MYIDKIANVFNVSEQTVEIRKKFGAMEVKSVGKTKYYLNLKRRQKIFEDIHYIKDDDTLRCSFHIY